MTLPISSVVNVGISVGAVFPSRAGFGTLNIITSDTSVIGSAERIRSYSNIEGVAADWPANSEVLKAATSYFSQNPRPTSLKVSVRFTNNVSAELRGASLPDSDADFLNTLVLITDGSFNISIDGVNNDITGINFTGDASYDDAAATIQTAIQAVATGGYVGATCTHDGNRFFITSGTSGATSTISYLSTVSPSTGTDLSSLLKLDQSLATKSDGIAAETITASLNAIQNINDDWYGFMFTKEVRDLVQINGENAVDAAATWAEARIKVFFNTTNSLDTLDSVSTSDIGYLLTTRNLRRTMTTFSKQIDEYPSASIAGRAFTVNFNQPNSTITLKFKQMPGITVQELTVNEKAALDSKNVNALLSIGSSNMFAESTMHNGSFFDETHGLDWLENAIQTNVFGYMLTRTTKVPYTDKGVSTIVQQLTKALDEAVANGLLAPGTTVDGEFLPNGYKIITVPVSLVNQSNKEGRVYDQVSFVGLGAGAIHAVQINGTFER